MRIIIAADVAPTASNIDLFREADLRALLGEELLSVWQSATLRIFNLEMPLADIENPIAKCGPNLMAPTAAVNGLKALKPSLVTLANNHIMDQGEEGLKSTIENLAQHEISFTGVGDHLAAACRPYVFDQEGVKIGIYACAEHEFSIARQNSPGANPFDPLESLDHIQSLKESCDYVIVVYHGGKEHYRYPSPYLRKVSRKMAEKGADLVVCQHSHCIGCAEKFGGSVIVYGQGNFIFDADQTAFWQSSLLIRIDLNGVPEIGYIPIVRWGNGIRQATAEEAAEILTQFHQRSAEIMEEGFIERCYGEFAKEIIQPYLRTFCGFGKWISRIDRKFFRGYFLRNCYDRERMLAMENFLACEAHRELVLAYLQQENKRRVGGDRFAAKSSN